MVGHFVVDARGRQQHGTVSKLTFSAAIWYVADEIKLRKRRDIKTVDNVGLPSEKPHLPASVAENSTLQCGGSFP